MHSLTTLSACATAVHCDDDQLTIHLADGRTLSVPVVWFPRLATASPSARAEYMLLGQGEGIHWPQLDEDISVATLLVGQASAERHLRP